MLDPTREVIISRAYAHAIETEGLPCGDNGFHFCQVGGYVDISRWRWHEPEFLAVDQEEHVLAVLSKGASMEKFMALLTWLSMQGKEDYSYRGSDEPEDC
jgi:hypothetical protein